MRLRMICALVTGAFVGLSLAWGSPPSIEQLEQFQPDSGEDRLTALVDELDRTVGAMDDATWSRLMALVNSPQRPWQLRVAVFTAIADESSEPQTLELVGYASTWLDHASDDRKRWAEDRTLSDGAETMLLLTFVDRITAAPWSQWAASDPRTLDLLTRMASERVAAGHLRGHLAGPEEAIVGLPAAPERLGMAAATVILANTRGSSVDARLYELLDDEAIARLRDAVTASGPDPLSFHLGAAGALAHLGDREIVPVLERLRPQYAASGPSLQEGREVNAGPKFAQVIDGMLRKIEAQHPPGALLTLINPGGPWTPDEPGRRAWALTRALQLGVPAERLREALLSRAHALREQFSDPISRNAPLLLTTSLRELKAAGVRHGVLTDADLPGVPMPKAH